MLSHHHYYISFLVIKALFQSISLQTGHSVLHLANIRGTMTIRQVTALGAGKLPVSKTDFHTHWASWLVGMGNEDPFIDVWVVDV